MALGQFPTASVLIPDLSPSFSSVFSTSWKEARRLRRRGILGNTFGERHPALQQRTIAQFQPDWTSSQSKCLPSRAPSSPPPPDFLRSAAMTTLQAKSPVLPSLPLSASWKGFKIITSKSPLDHGSIPASVRPQWRPQAQQDAHLSARQATIPTLSPKRGASSSPLFMRSFHGPSILRSSLPHGHQRFYTSSSNSTPQSMLAHAERTANNNPNSASAQAAFYSALLRANMHKIIIERYQIGRYASSATADAAYLEALQHTGSLPVPGSNGMAAENLGAAASQMSPSRLQAVAQAVAAQSVDGPATAATGKKVRGSGAEDAPLHVVVDQSKRTLFFRTIKYLVSTAITLYILFVIMMLGVEMTGSLRTATAQNHEVQPQHQPVRFSDVHGCDEAKDELQELVEFLLNPNRFSSLGGKLPKGVLLVGPPGTGKTMLARAVAGEAGCPFFYMSGSEFDEMYVGVGAKRVRDLFSQARAKSPAIIFIDELDAVGGKRNERDPAYAKQTLNQLLTELDGFSPSTGVILIAATNYPQSLDKALTRPGRFDRRVQVPLPDVRGRVAILKHHMTKVALSPDVDPTLLARGTSGFSGADLENLVNQAAVHASRKKLKKIGSLEFEWAKDKIMMGAEARSRMIREEDKISTAYHEAGHALVNLLTPGAAQLHKMTIVPRGVSLGVTHMLPDMDAVSRDYQQYLADIDVNMGGRAAEEMIYGADHVASGIVSDLSNATQIAYALVTQFGFSEKLGNVDLHSHYDRLSSQTKQEIENEMRTIVEDARRRADSILRSRRGELELLKDALMEYETLTREEILQVMRGEKLNKQLEPDTRDPKKDTNQTDEKEQGKGGSPQPPKQKETGKKGGVGIKLPEVLMPSGTRREEGGRQS